MLSTNPTALFKYHPRTKEAFRSGSINTNLVNLLIAMMDSEPAKRLTIEEVLSHAYFSDSEMLEQ